MHKKSKEIIAIYEDADGSFKTENAIYSGHFNVLPGEGKVANVMDNFYAKLAEIDVSKFLQKFCYWPELSVELSR